MTWNNKWTFVVALCALVGSTARASDQPLSITISTGSPVVKVGSEIVVKLTVKNISKRKRNVAKSNGPLQAELYYQVFVRDGHGNTPKETKYERQITGKEPVNIQGSTVYVTLAPNEALSDDLLLNKLFELNEPGRYSVQVTREIPKELGGGLIKSNILQITITE